jgi:hypothetical protein
MAKKGLDAYDKPSYVLVSRDDAMFFYRLRGELAGVRRLGKEKKGEKVANIRNCS